ncbi:MAG TPA: MFS transporter [Pseudonocardiaceae bacterium]|nr:MFS transporter [Pseudonocardiaceae bacterium]
MHRGRVAVIATFAFNGVVVGTWTSRVPAVAAHVHASPGSLGLVLLGGSIGLIVAAPLVSRLCLWFGAKVVVPPCVILCSVAMTLIGVAGTVPWLGVAMFGLGMAIGALDVSMNIAAVSVVRELDRPLMPTFHGAYSFGALGGGVLAGALVAAGWSPVPHFVVVAGIGVLLAVAVARDMPGGRPAPAAGQPKQPVARMVPPIRRLALWLMAGIMLCSAVAEGASGDWSALFLVRERDVSQSAATVGFACFNVAMAVARLLGERWERRWGPYRLLGGGAAVAAVGMFAVVIAPWVVVSYIGFALVGMGLAFSFPVTIGLAGAAGRRSDGSGGEREIGFVTTIAYSGFLAGPPVIGAIAQTTDIAVGLGVVGLVVALIVPMVLLSRRVRDRELLQGPAETAYRQHGPDERQPRTGGQGRDHAGADGHAQREVP